MKITQLFYNLIKQLKSNIMKTKMLVITGLFLLFSIGSFAQTGVVVVDIKTSAKSELCKDKIEEALVYTSGVKDAVLNLDTKIVTVKYKTAKISKTKILKIITDLGYDADDQKKNKDAYKKLPAKCKSASPNPNCGHSCNH